MTRHVAISAIGPDGPGIVSVISTALCRHGCNLEDTSMTVLSGRFAMVLLVSVPDGMATARLEQDLAASTSGLGLAVRVHDVDEQAPGTERGEIWTVAVHGADRTGIVSAVTSALAEAGVSIHDLSTRLVGTGPPIYSMLLEVVVPDGVDPEAVADRLAAVATELEVALAMRPADADIL